MKAALTTLLALALALLPLQAAPTRAQATDPNEMIDNWELYINIADVDAALALLADDAVITFTPDPLPTDQPVYRGKAEIHAWLQKLDPDRAHVQTLDDQRQVSGNIVTYVTRFSRASLRERRIDPVDLNTVAVLEDGKIKSLTFSFTAASQSEFRAATACTQLSSAPAPEGTGPLSVDCLNTDASGAFTLGPRGATQSIGAGETTGNFRYFRVYHSGADTPIHVTYGPADPGMRGAFGIHIYGPNGEDLGEVLGDTERGGRGIASYTISGGPAGWYIVQVFNHAISTAVTFTIAGVPAGPAPTPATAATPAS